MTQKRKNVSMDAELVRGVLVAQDDFLRPLVQEMLEAKMIEELGAEKSERTDRRQVLAVEWANRESRSIWWKFLLQLRFAGQNPRSGPLFPLLSRQP